MVHVPRFACRWGRVPSVPVEVPIKGVLWGESLGEAERKAAKSPEGLP